MSKSLKLLSALMVSGALSACATMPSEPPTAAQRASCEEMMRMGQGATHNHSADKGTGVQNAMGMTHAQCRRMMKG